MVGIPGRCFGAADPKIRRIVPGHFISLLRFFPSPSPSRPRLGRRKILVPFSGRSSSSNRTYARVHTTTPPRTVSYSVETIESSCPKANRPLRDFPVPGLAREELRKPYTAKRDDKIE